LEAAAMTDVLVPTRDAEVEFVEKRSRFIGRVWRVETEQEALDHIRAMREQHWDATHNVYCYIVREQGIMRYSDDGEPGGTAGMPALEVFRREGITNFCCVITRYFGGVLLGAGGLVRAYANSAKLALDAAGVSEMCRWVRVRTVCDYGLFERVKKTAEVCGGTVGDCDFADRVTVNVLLPEGETESFSEKIRELSSGAVTPETLGEEFLPVPIR